MAPEVFQPGLAGRETPVVTLESDVYSFGMVILEVLRASYAAVGLTTDTRST